MNEARLHADEGPRVGVDLDLPANAAHRLGQLLVSTDGSKAFKWQTDLARRILTFEDRLDPDTLQVYLSKLFNGKGTLHEYLEVALQKTIAEAIRKNKAKLDKQWRREVKGCLHVLSMDRYVDGKGSKSLEGSMASVVSALAWADTVYVVTSGLDPVMRGWPDHPLDTLIHDILLPADRSDGQVPLRGRPHLVIAGSKETDSKAWLFRMMLPHFLKLHGERFMHDRNVPKHAITSLSTEFLKPLTSALQKGDDEDYLRMHVLPSSFCWLPFFMTTHGWVDQAFLNVPSSGDDHFKSVSLDTIVDNLGLPRTLFPNASTRFRPDTALLKREATDYFLKAVWKHHAGEKEPSFAAAKGDRFQPYNLLDYGKQPKSKSEAPSEGGGAEMV